MSGKPKRGSVRWDSAQYMERVWENRKEFSYFEREIPTASNGPRDLFDPGMSLCGVCDLILQKPVA